MKILVVEDEQRVAHYIKKGLEMKSYIVDLAYNGLDGYDFATSESYDLIILDRLLPEMNGIEVCSRLRKNKVHTPILMLTALDAVDERVTGLEAGCDDYLGKPFAFSELFARIKVLTRRPKVLVSEVLTVDDLTLNTNTYEVKRDQTIINLSRKEYDLLGFLLRNRGKVFSKDQLIAEVWPYDSEVLSNTAQVYIRYLRDKIDRNFPKKKTLIKTIRGFGYTIQL
tara:strand:- start:636 stop:1310 length:675 start_codon:yes stop_codon:yes gene_type:complete